MASIPLDEWRQYLRFLSTNVGSFYYPYPVPGGRMFLDITESPMMLARALGDYEVVKHRAIAAWLRPGQTMLDVGANKGDFTLLAARIVGPAGYVLAFEPEPDNCRWLRKSIAINGYTQLALVEAALSDENGETRLYLGGKSGWHSLEPGQSPERPSVAVRQCRLDDYLDAHHIDRRIHLMKIDVEGAELRVLRGAERTLRRKDVCLVMDLHPHLGVDPSEVVEFLRSLDFEIYPENSPEGPPIRDGLIPLSLMARKTQSPRRAASEAAR